MILPIVGSIRNTVKLAAMDAKWQQKKANGGKALKEEMDPQARQIQRYKEDIQKMRENNQMSSIDAKLKAGGLLTPEEISYLQKNSPQKYREYLEIRSEREAYKRQLKSCKTKEDVEKLKMTKMNSLLAEAKSVMNNPNIPKGKKVGLMEKILMKTMGVQEEHMEFVRSGQYHALPTEEEIAEEAKEKVEQGEELAEEMGDNIADDMIENMEQNNSSIKMPEADNEVDPANGISVKEIENSVKKIENKEEKSGISLEMEKHKTYALPELKEAADMVFQELEVKLKGYLKAYRI